MLYLRFAFCLAFGLMGVVLFMMTIMDTLLVNYDAGGALRNWFRSLFIPDRKRYVDIDYAKKRAAKEKAFAGQFLAGPSQGRIGSDAPQLTPPAPSYL